jgi:hypothetical protein
MKRISTRAALLGTMALLALLALAGCGGGGSGGTSSAAALSAGGENQAVKQPGVFTRNGTIHFNQLAVAAMTIQDDNGAVLTPVNPPSDALEGERVSITFEYAADPLPSTFVRTPPNPIVIFSLRVLPPL